MLSSDLGRHGRSQVAMGTKTADEPVLDVFNPLCLTRQVLDLIGDRWTVMIVLTLLDGTKRFGEAA